MLVTSGRCAIHAPVHARARVAAKREVYGECRYDTPQWRSLRNTFRRRLIQAGIAPACGARLPGAPVTHDSHCQQSGRLRGDDEHRRLTGQRLTVDHIIPHRGDTALYESMTNMQLLCGSEHQLKSNRERAQ